MATLDIFRQDAFSALSMTRAVDKLGYVPGLLGSIPGLFDPVPVYTTDIMIEEREHEAALIQTSERGAEPAVMGQERRNVRAFRTTRLFKHSRLMAHELQNIRAFGTESELAQVQAEVARRQFRMRRDVELTHEHMRLGAVQGQVIDADGSVIYDWASEFGQAIPAEIDFDLDNADPESGAVRKKCNQVTRSILRALKGLGGNQVSIMALAGDNFWDDLTAHPEVRETYLNTQAASDLREGNAFESFRYGGITWTNYRGTDDGSTVAVGEDKARFFPVGSGIFQVAWAPAERFDLANMPGQELYSWVVPDDRRNAFVDVELYSYPLHVCTMPSALHRARRT